MSFPGQDQDNPQRVSAAVGVAGFVQDVVAATSRLIHNVNLTERDQVALIACQDLLQRLRSPEIALVRTGDRGLSGSEAVTLFRRAQPEHPWTVAEIESAAGALERLMNGDRDEEVVAAVRDLRDVFLALGEANLGMMTRKEQREEGADGWMPLMANLSS
jgi:hypothetical protein